MQARAAAGHNSPPFISSDSMFDDSGLSQATASDAHCKQRVEWTCSTADMDQVLPLAATVANAASNKCMHACIWYTHAPTHCKLNTTTACIIKSPEQDRDRESMASDTFWYHWVSSNVDKDIVRLIILGRYSIQLADYLIGMCTTAQDIHAHDPLHTKQTRHTYVVFKKRHPDTVTVRLATARQQQRPPSVTYYTHGSSLVF